MRPQNPLPEVIVEMVTAPVSWRSCEYSLTEKVPFFSLYRPHTTTNYYRRATVYSEGKVKECWPRAVMLGNSPAFGIMFQARVKVTLELPLKHEWALMRIFCGLATTCLVGHLGVYMARAWIFFWIPDNWINLHPHPAFYSFRERGSLDWFLAWFEVNIFIIWPEAIPWKVAFWHVTAFF